MENYPRPARQLVAQMVEAAQADPQQAVSFQGAPGAYSHRAALEVFPDSPLLPCFSFEDAFDAVQDGRVGRALIPIENSLHGRVADIHFLLPDSGLSVVGEHFLRVEHCLLGLPGTKRSDLREVMSHPQALGQARKRLRSWGLKPVVYADTAAAAALVADQGDRHIGAIASDLAGELFGLDVIERGIEDEPHNTTRFVVLSQQPIDPEPGSEPLMTSLIFEVRNVPAALYKALGGFATNGVNMTKLESYQLGGTFSATQFYLDIEGSPRSPNVALALDELRFQAKSVRILGTYPRARERIVAEVA